MLKHITDCLPVYIFFNLRHIIVKICVFIHVSFLKYNMCTFRLHMLFELEY